MARPRETFEHELEQLNADLVRMGALVEEAIEQAITAFQNQDEQLARSIVAHDRQINDMEKTIEARCLSLIMRQQPVARDLRIISASLKIVTDMERIGAQAADISDLILRIRGEHVYKLAEHIPEMAKNARQMVHDAITAFVNRNLVLAGEVQKQDDVVDDLFNRVKAEVAQMLRSESEAVDTGIDLLMIAKYLERIGDHAVNICEWLEFDQTGELPEN